MIAARALRGTGDWETLPYLAEIEDDLKPRRLGHTGDQGDNPRK
jgi:hypothetical protein